MLEVQAFTPETVAAQLAAHGLRFDVDNTRESGKWSCRLRKQLYGSWCVVASSGVRDTWREAVEFAIRNYGVR